ncbi:MAG: hypothetical protein WBL31_09775 [Ilumatobacteraceae bacterium]
MRSANAVAVAASTFVFDNDFPALLRGVPQPPTGDDHRFQVEAATGDCQVICFSPRHDLTLATMDHADLVGVVDLWRTQLDDLLGVLAVRDPGAQAAAAIG